MEVRRYLSIIRRRALLILAIIGASIAAGYLITPKTETYTATALLYVGSESIDFDPRSGQVSADRAAGFDRLINSWTQLLKTRKMALAAIRETGIERTPSEVTGSITAVQPPFSNNITISVVDRDPATARAMANGVAEVFERRIEGIEPGAEDSNQEVLTIVQPATLPTAANATDLIRNLALATLFGIIVAGGVVALLEHLDITIRSNDDVERHLELVVLGVIPALGERLPTPPPARIEGFSQREGRERGAPVG
jgi:capsular polysaccharide biosynthesis protein